MVLLSISLAGSNIILHLNNGEEVSLQTNEINEISFQTPPQFIESIMVNSGTFQMGDYFYGAVEDEVPVHEVSMRKFLIGKYEITQAQYEEVMGNNPAHDYGVGDNFPVYYVSWFDAIQFCNTLSTLEGYTPCYTVSGYDVTSDINADGWRLPTEAEWEYAAKGGTNWQDSLIYSGCNEDSQLPDYAHYEDNNSPYGTKEVGRKIPNQLGIYDMSGNVFEWCWDYYGQYYYQECFNQGVVTNPTGPEDGSYRVKRGGFWEGTIYGCRVADRAIEIPGNFNDIIGFRVVRSVK